MGTQWHGMGRKMMDIDVFKSSILRSDTILKPYNVNLFDMLVNGEESTFEDTINSFVGIAAIQVKHITYISLLQRCRIFVSLSTDQLCYWQQSTWPSS